MNSLKLIYYDLKNGFQKNMDKLGLLILVILFCRISSFFTEWILINVVILYGTLNYTFRDFEELGMQILPRCRNRGKWWAAKSTWIVSFAAVSHGLVYVFAKLFEDLNTSGIPYYFGPSILRRILIPDETVKTGTWKITLVMIVLSMLTTMLLNIIQMTLTLFLTQKIAFCVTFFLLVYGEIFKGSVSMGSIKLRIWMEMMGQYGITEAQKIYLAGILLIIIIITMLIGKWKFRKYDILGHSL